MRGPPDGGPEKLMYGRPMVAPGTGYLSEPGSTLWTFLNMLIKALTFS